MTAPNPVAVIWWWRYESAAACAVGFVVWRTDLRVVALAGAVVMVPLAALAPIRHWFRRRVWCVITPHRLRVGFARAGFDLASGLLPAVLLTRSRGYGERVYVLVAREVSLPWIGRAAGTVAEACWAERVTFSAFGSWDRIVIVDVLRWPSTPPTSPRPRVEARTGSRNEPPPVERCTRDDLAAGPDCSPDKYLLRARLGSGGEGTVWLAEQRLSVRGRCRVAVKVLHGGPDQQCFPSWTEHVDVLRSVNHRGLVRVIDGFVGPPAHPFGERPGGQCRYIVMEHVRGEPLTAWLTTHRRLPLAERLMVLSGVAAALDEMHSGAQTVVPVVHGDVKPGNIIVPGDRHAVLVDVGLMRIVDGGGRLGRSRPYAAPELFRPNAISTPQADRYAFVATVLSVVLQAVPPHGDAGLDVVAVERLLGGLPRELRWSLVGALTCPAERRPANLERWLSAIVRQADAMTVPPAPCRAPASGCACPGPR